MNSEIDFNNLSLSEINARCHQKKLEKQTLEDERRRCENDLQQMRSARQTLRQQSQTLLEQLIAALLPDLSAPVQLRLRQIFPDQMELFRAAADDGEANDGLWQKINSFFLNLFGDANAANPLEERRILLRNVLWQLSRTPPNAGDLNELFRRFLSTKNDFFAHEKAMRQPEAKINEIVERISILNQTLSRCDEYNSRRKNVLHTTDDPHVYEQNSDEYIYLPSSESDSAQVNASSGAAARLDFDVSADSPEQNASTEDAASSFSGFGGGGDFAGGGAGGSWENYS